MSESAEAYPLCWPAGWRRTSAQQRTRAKFHRMADHNHNAPGSGSAYKTRVDLTVEQAVDRVMRELGALRVDEATVVISSNLELRRDGWPRSGQRAPADPGAAVYWAVRKTQKTRCIAIDTYDRVQDNMAAIAGTLAAMRAIDRYGGAEILDRAFTGFTALPAPEQWWQVLGLTSKATLAEIDDAYRVLALRHHPDRGGNTGEMARINRARDDGYRYVTGAGGLQ